MNLPAVSGVDLLADCRADSGMSPLTHFVGSWLVAVVVAEKPQDRRLITFAGILPDLDGAGMVVDLARYFATGGEFEFVYYQKFHHLWLHGWPGALVLVAALTCFARQRWRVAIGCLITFHLHLLCDLLGSRGPSPADLWPICYGEPLFRHPIWIWKGQWRLDGWQNQLVFGAVFIAALGIAVRRGYSFVEIFSIRADRSVVAVLRDWSGRICGSSKRPPRDDDIRT